MIRTETTPNGVLLNILDLDIGDVRNIMRWVSDKEITFYFASIKEITEDEERAFVKQLIVSPTDKAFSVFEADSSAYVGQIAIKIDWVAKTGRLFVVITKEMQGKDYAIPIIRAAQQIAFEELGLNKLYLIVRYDNAKAHYIYKRCGFEQEGVLREEYCIGDTFYDMVRMAILKKDYLHWWNANGWRRIGKLVCAQHKHI